MAWAPFAERVPSPNFTKGRPYGILGALQHSTVGNWDSALAELTRADSSPVSAHFLLGLDGRIAQLVDTENQAWHAMSCNTRWVGIEYVDNGKHWDPVRTPAQYNAGAKVNAWLADVHGYEPSSSTIKPHWTCVATACPSGLDVERIILETIAGGDMTAEAVKAVIREMLLSEEGANLVKYAVLRYPNGYGVGLQAFLDASYVRRDGTLGTVGVPNVKALKRATRAKVRAGHGKAKKKEE